MADLLDLWNGTVSLTDDHEAVDLEVIDGLLRRIIVCCDCGLVHLMSVDAGARRAYFVRDDGPKSEEIRARGRAAGHVFPRERYDIDADHDWALWREKWTATLDTYSSLLEKERDALSSARQRISVLERALSEARALAAEE